MALGWTDPQGDLLTPSEVSERFKISMVTLRIWRKRKTGPPCVRLAPRTIRYRRKDVERWLKTKQDP